MIIKNIKEQDFFTVQDNTKLTELFPSQNNTPNSLPYSLAYAELLGYKKSSPHRLQTSVELYIIVKGKGIMHINDEQQQVTKDQVVYIPKNSIQYIENTTKYPLGFYCIVSPPYQQKDDHLIEK